MTESSAFSPFLKTLIHFWIQFSSKAKKSSVINSISLQKRKFRPWGITKITIPNGNSETNALPLNRWLKTSSVSIFVHSLQKFVKFSFQRRNQTVALSAKSLLYEQKIGKLGPQLSILHGELGPILIRSSLRGLGETQERLKVYRFLRLGGS